MKCPKCGNDMANKWLNYECHECGRTIAIKDGEDKETPDNSYVKENDTYVNNVLTRRGIDYLPSEVIDGGFIVDEFADIEITDIEDNIVNGTCYINCYQDENDEDDIKVSFFAEFEIDMESEEIKFSNVEMEDYS
jgi:hypothetical protein